jgi:hypothetical protein
MMVNPPCHGRNDHLTMLVGNMMALRRAQSRVLEFF